MSAAHLLDELRTLGVKVWPDAGVLRFKAPAEVMTPELTTRLRAAKPELLSMLVRKQARTMKKWPARTCPCWPPSTSTTR